MEKQRRKTADEELVDIQNYLREKGINVSVTEITKASMKIAQRWGGKGVYICELREKV